MSNKICKKDAVYLALQNAYCKFLHASYDYADAILDYIMVQKQVKNKKCCIVLDHDGVLQSEDSCTNFETFTRAMNFIKITKEKYGDRITIAVITARRSSEGLKELYTQHGVRQFIEVIMYDINGIGTKDSKIQNRNLLRSQGYTIIISLGDNQTDTVPDSETYGSKTANILLSNVYRQTFD